MSLAALIAFLKANNTLILSLWVIFEQFLAADQRFKSNSTLQLVVNVVNALLNKDKNASE